MQSTTKKEVIELGKIYAVDFDGTLCQRKYPKIGAPIQEVIDYVKDLSADGHRLILWTCRCGDSLQEAIDWCSARGLEFDAINENLQSEIDAWESDPRKVSADFYIDDKCVTVESIISEKEAVNLTKTTKQFQRMWEIKQSASPEVLEVYIYGDVEGDRFDWWSGQIIESETSANHFRETLAEHPDVTQINIYINSYGGSVFEGTAIFSQLKRHPAQKTAYIDGFACSIATVIAMAADKVVMPRNTSMMIHNAWMVAIGNTAELRKAADDLEKINQANRQAYLMKAGDKLTEEKLVALLDAESWLTAEDCIALGLADEYADADADLTGAADKLKQMNMNVSQQLKLHKSIAAQLRQLTEPTKEPVAEPAPVISPTPAEPEGNKVLDLFKAIGRKEKKE